MNSKTTTAASVEDAINTLFDWIDKVSPGWKMYSSGGSEQCLAWVEAVNIIEAVGQATGGAQLDAEIGRFGGHFHSDIIWMGVDRLEEMPDHNEWGEDPEDLKADRCSNCLDEPDLPPCRHWRIPLTGVTFTASTLGHKGSKSISVP